MTQVRGAPCRAPFAPAAECSLATRQRLPPLLALALADALTIRPAPPGDERSPRPLALPLRDVTVDVAPDAMADVVDLLTAGALTFDEAVAALLSAETPSDLAARLLARLRAPGHGGAGQGGLATAHGLDRLVQHAAGLVERARRALLTVPPLTEVHFHLTDAARAVAALGWEALVKRGGFPALADGPNHAGAGRAPTGLLCFLPTSEPSEGFHRAAGLAQSPEAQARQTTELGYGLDLGLVAPETALALRLAASAVPIIWNVGAADLARPPRTPLVPGGPVRVAPAGSRGAPARGELDAAVASIRRHLLRHRFETERLRRATLPDHAAEPLPLASACDVTSLSSRAIARALRPILAHEDLGRQKAGIALAVRLGCGEADRAEAVCDVVDAARALGLRHVAVSDNEEDAGLPGLLEYLTAEELGEVADHADHAGVLVVDGRPVDTAAAAAAAARRVWEANAAWSADLVRAEVWGDLDALAARAVWRDLLATPRWPGRGFLPAGVLDPDRPFADNRDPARTARPIVEPFAKVKFLIEEAAALGASGVLTTTRDTEAWVLLGRKTPRDLPHPRERFAPDAAVATECGRVPGSAVPLLSWDEFLACERLARQAGIMLVQSGSITAAQMFRIASELTADAARDGRNPATAVRIDDPERGGSAAFLAVVNRALEAHGKLDGWLRYLHSAGRGDEELRLDLARWRDRLGRLLDQCLRSQRETPGHYQEDWDAYREAYVAYHNRIRARFTVVQQAVADLWAAGRGAVGEPILERK